jgi:hypothetical protein
VTGEPRRRWVSEQTVLEELERLSDLSMATVADYSLHAREAAEAEADHKRLRAKRILLAKSNGETKAQAAAEVIAEADDEVAAAYHRRLVSAAMADVDRESLRSIRTNQEALRTAAASARDGVVGPGMSGRR